LTGLIIWALFMTAGYFCPAANVKGRTRAKGQSHGMSSDD